MNTQFDIAIIGGGPVGAALALALRDSKLKVCVLEARPANSASNDARALALSYGSRLLLARLGVWDALHDVSAIRTIHISQKQSFGRAVLRADETERAGTRLCAALPGAARRIDRCAAAQRCCIHLRRERHSVEQVETDTP